RTGRDYNPPGFNGDPGFLPDFSDDAHVGSCWGLLTRAELSQRAAELSCGLVEENFRIFFGTAMSLSDKQIYEFGPFALDPAERILRLAGAPVPLEPKAFDTLVVLVERSGRLVEKEELLRQVWPGTFVEEVNLARNISVLRKALAQGFAEQPCIETVPKHGYRFIAVVTPTLPELVITETTTSLTVEEELTIHDDEPERHASGWPRIVVFAGLLLLVAFGVGLAFRLERTPKPAPAIKSIAVLPFKPLDQASREPYLEIGMADTLITRLSALNAVAVRPTSAIRRYAEQEFDSLAVGRVLSVDAVLEGSLQRLGDRLRVTVRLLRVADGQSLWAHQCDTACTDIFQTQDTVSRQVAEALRPSLSPAEQQALTKRGTNDVEAYQLYLKGQYFFNKRNAEGYSKAFEHFAQAIARDPNYALAYNGLALTEGWLIDTGVPRAEALAKFKARLQQAAALDPTLPEVHASLGLSAQNVDWDWVAAEREFQLAIQLNPNYATAHHWYGEHLFLVRGRYAEGLRELRLAQALDPLSLAINSDIAKCFYFARQYDEAIAQARKTLELDSQFILPHYWLFFSLHAQGRFAEAQEVAEKIQSLDGSLMARANVGCALAALGQRQQARQVLAELLQASQRRYVAPVLIAALYHTLDEPAAACAWLEKAYAERSTEMLTLRIAWWDKMNAEPCFQSLLKRLNLPE
ncbi:MAG: winged helix-turn-helix domain-containing tetratricopeptide repeat protein, partial [Blastocatellia bacterium]